MNAIVLLIGVFFFLIMEGFFSGSEFGVVSYNRLKLGILEKQGKRSAIILSRFLRNSHKFLATTLLGTNLCVVINTVLITAFFSEMYGEKKGAVIAIIIFTPMTLLFGEILPKMIFKRKKETLTLNVAKPLNVFFSIFTPFVKVFVYLSGKILKILKVKKGIQHTLLKDDIKFLFLSQGFGKRIDPACMEILQRVFDFSKIEVSDIMVPLVKLQAASISSLVSDITRMIRDSGYSRIPVYKNEIYNIVGIVYGFDLLSVANPSDRVEKYLKSAYYVPKNMKISKLLRELQCRKLQLAVVVDEYGGNIGIVTMEDLLEELVGEIIDEYDKEDVFIKKISKNLYLVKAQTRIVDLNRFLKVDIEKIEFETVGGLLLHLFEKIPQKGDKVSFNDLSFIIKDVTPTRIEWVLIRIKE
jgi:putative hemolysin